MSEGKDPAIKLFGRNIPVPESHIPAESSKGSSSNTQNNDGSEPMDECSEAIKNKAKDPTAQSSSGQDALSSSKGKERNFQDSVQESEKPEEGQTVGSEMSSEQKVLKKPDKILPCPRCTSMDTKFCYFNNYNVNQPRHFCRNCQRYWTAGGTMRNVPIGSGRRKNKHASSQYHQLVLAPGAVPGMENEAVKPTSQWHLSGVRVPMSSRPLEGLGEVLKCSSDAPLCQSMATVLNLKDHKGNIESSPVSTEDSGVESSLCRSFSRSGIQENELHDKEMNQVGITEKSYGSHPAHSLQFPSGPTWPYPWNPGWNAMPGAPQASNSNPVYMACPPMMIPGYCSPGTTIPVVPVPGWNCITRIPFYASSSCASPSSSTTSSGCSGDSTPTLGKHSRDTNLKQEEKTEQCLWVPKTLRINDPDDAAKSPIWDTLGISPKEPVTKGSILKALQSKSDGSSHTSDSDQVLQANPAALSRFQSFHEST